MFETKSWIAKSLLTIAIKNKTYMSELLYRVALTKIPKVGAVTSRKLIAHFGSAEAVFRAKKSDFGDIQNIGEAIAKSILNTEVLTWAERELDFIDKNQIQVLFHTDDQFPHRLRQLHDCPMLLYYRGNADLNAPRIVAVVGTRKASSYGIRHCEEITEGLSSFNSLIISGLAYGVDIAAHRRCVDLNVPTVGIMGSGLQRIYPNDHRDTALRMMENGGVLTEYPSDQDPEAMHFPMRNRIIAGMCDALIVIETEAKGGSMITANLAADYNREIFALPGRIDDRKSKGCYDLMRRQRATLIESVEGIAQTLGWTQSGDAPKPVVIQSQLFIELSDNEQLMIDTLSKFDKGAAIDALHYDTQLSQAKVAALLLELEFKGLVRALPGKRFIKI